jgi:hypothetical protein
MAAEVMARRVGLGGDNSPRTIAFLGGIEF